ncbi:hypothetical protein DOY81_009035, partial [Sarcophaga bullata]
MVAASKLNQVFTYESWVHAVSGAAGGCIAMSTFYPLDTVRSRLQLEDPDKSGEARSTMKVIKEIVLGEGFQSLYRGLGPSLLSGLQYVAKTEGIKGLWSGTIPSLILVSNPSLQFMMYELLKRNYMKFSNRTEISSLGYFLIGAAAKAFATVLTYPLQLVQTKQRHRSKHVNCPSTSKQAPGNEEIGMIQMILNIIRHQGFKGLFRGMEAKILQTVLTAALMFMAYEKINNTVGLLLKRTPAK